MEEDNLDGILELKKDDGVYIDIGTKVYLEIDGVNFSVTSIFIGLLLDEFIIITLPKRYKSVKNKLFAGNSIIVKYLFDGSVFAFQTSVIEMITTPIQALALNYPKVVQRRELRILKRNNVVMPIRIEAKKTELAAIIVDISKKGCRFKYQELKNQKITFRETDLIRIFCKFPGVAQEVGVLANVRNIYRKKNQISIGAEFEDMTRDFFEPLMHLLFSIEGFS